MEYIQEHDCNTDDHCWHGLNFVVTTNPPEFPEYCCHCNESRISFVMNKTPSHHGKFLRLPVEGVVNG